MLEFNEPVFYGRLIKRYKRFLMDVELDCGTIVTAHTPNTGSMMGLLDGKHRVLLTKSSDPKRACPYTTQGIAINGSMVGINTHAPNRLIAASLAHPLLEPLNHYRSMKTEKPYGEGKRSRVDFYFSASDTFETPLYLEIKNVTLKDGDHARFPDAVSLRAQKHIDDLQGVRGLGFQAALWFIVQRQDCLGFSAAHHIDKVYARKLTEAHRLGLRIRALAARLDERGLALTHEIPCYL